MIKITHKKQVGYYADNLLPNICFSVCGKGMTAKNTADAMELQTKVRSNGSAKYKGYTIELETE